MAFLCASAGIGLALPTAAIAGDLVGSSVDASGTRALQGAEVEIVELGRVDHAGTDGRFRFADLPAGPYTVRARYAGTEPVSANATVTAAGVRSEARRLGNECVSTGRARWSQYH